MKLFAQLKSHPVTTALVDSYNKVRFTATPAFAASVLRQQQLPLGGIPVRTRTIARYENVMFGIKVLLVGSNGISQTLIDIITTSTK